MNPPKTTTILLQEAVAAYLGDPTQWPAAIQAMPEARFPAEMEIVARRDKDLESDVDAALGRLGAFVAGGAAGWSGTANGFAVQGGVITGTR